MNKTRAHLKWIRSCHYCCVPSTSSIIIQTSHIRVPWVAGRLDPSAPRLASLSYMLQCAAWSLHHSQLGSSAVMPMMSHPVEMSTVLQSTDILFVTHFWATLSTHTFPSFCLIDHHMKIDSKLDRYLIFYPAQDSIRRHSCVYSFISTMAECRMSVRI